MKKVCILTSVHPVFDPRIFEREAKTLVKIGFSVILIAQHSKNEVVEGINIIALPKPKNRLFRFFGTTWKTYIAALKQKTDIYHIHDPELIPAALILKLSTKAKVIYDVHENYPNAVFSKHWLPGPSKKIVSALLDIFERLAARLFDCIIAANDDIKQRFEGYKMVVDIKNYPALASISQLPESTPATGEKYTLIYAGGLERGRSIKEIIQSLDFVDPKYNVKLKLIGKFSESDFQKEIEKLMRSNERIEFINWLPYQEMLTHVQKADIGFVLFHPKPNLVTGMPNKIFEYMALGIPMIASDFPLWKKLIQENGCGLLVNPQKPEEIAHAVEFLLDNPDLRLKMRENGLRLSREKYNWEKESEKLIAIYKFLIAGKI